MKLYKILSPSFRKVFLKENAESNFHYDSISFQYIRRRLNTPLKFKKILFETCYANEYKTYIFWKHLLRKSVLNETLQDKSIRI